MPKSKATWPKGQKPPVSKPKGRKNNKTLVKEAIGLQNWDGLKTFIETQGATKLISEIKKLKGKSYVMAVDAFAEYFKPKLSRQTIDAGDQTQVKIVIKKTNAGT